MARGGGIAADRLRSFLERIERLEEEKAGLTADIREIYAEAKGSGFDTKVMRQIVRLRKMDSADRQEQEALLERLPPAPSAWSDRPPSCRRRAAPWRPSSPPG